MVQIPLIVVSVVQGDDATGQATWAITVTNKTDAPPSAQSPCWVFSCPDEATARLFTPGKEVAAALFPNSLAEIHAKMQEQEGA